MNDQVKEFAANVYETFSAPQELQKWSTKSEEEEDSRGMETDVI